MSDPGQRIYVNIPGHYRTIQGTMLDAMQSAGHTALQEFDSTVAWKSVTAHAIYGTIRGTDVRVGVVKERRMVTPWSLR